MSQQPRVSASFMASAVSTRSDVSSKPPALRACMSSSASADESSTSSARSGLGTAADPGRHHGGFRRQLVEQGPECAELLDGFHELSKRDWLDDVRVDTKLVAAKEVDLLTRGRQHDDRCES